MPCTIDCLSYYSCSQNVIGDLNRAATRTPFVTVSLNDETGYVITVGNKSSPQWNNHAVIKSFECGMSNGCGCSMEIIDEEGSDFVYFMTKLTKSLKNAKDTYKMSVNFGWIVQDCNGYIQKIGLPKPLWFNPWNVKASYTGSLIRFKVEGQNLMSAMKDSRVSKPYGSNDQKMALKDAINALLTEQTPENSNPKVTSVKYWRKQNGTVDQNAEWGFKAEDNTGTTGDSTTDTSGKGPKAVWTPDRQNPVATIRRWVANLTTDAGKGIIFTFNPANDGKPQIILWEDPGPGDNELGNVLCEQSLGTFIVGGGQCSSVISFNPTAEWKFFSGVGQMGQSGGSVSGETSTMDNKPPDEGNDDIGQQNSYPPEWNQLSWRPPDKILELNRVAQIAHTKATRPYEYKSTSVEAELQIVGNVDFANPLQVLVGGRVSIIVINPMFITNMGLGGCGDWLANPVCNSQWSNKNWMIAGVHHQIKEGSYVTTLNVRLLVPGLDLPPTAPLGGAGSGGPTYSDTA